MQCRTNWARMCWHNAVVRPFISTVCAAAQNASPLTNGARVCVRVQWFRSARSSHLVIVTHLNFIYWVVHKLNLFIPCGSKIFSVRRECKLFLRHTLAHVEHAVACNGIGLLEFASAIGVAASPAVCSVCDEFGTEWMKIRGDDTVRVCERVCMFVCHWPHRSTRPAEIDSDACVQVREIYWSSISWAFAIDSANSRKAREISDVEWEKGRE